MPPVYMKFHPAPTSVNATTKCVTVVPLSATAAPPAMTATPARITFRTPKRLKSPPVTKPGAYMPTTCHSMTNAAWANGWLQKLIASGVATISRFIMP